MDWACNTPSINQSSFLFFFFFLFFIIVVVFSSSSSSPSSSSSSSSPLSLPACLLSPFPLSNNYFRRYIKKQPNLFSLIINFNYLFISTSHCNVIIQHFQVFHLCLSRVSNRFTGDLNDPRHMGQILDLRCSDLYNKHPV